MAVNGAELRVGRKRRLRVTGHVDFRSDLHMPSCREGDNLAYLLLGVVATVPLRARAPRNRCRNSPRPHRRKLWVLANLQAPALIIGQMPVQHVELVPR